MNVVLMPTSTLSHRERREKISADFNTVLGIGPLPLWGEG